MEFPQQTMAARRLLDGIEQGTMSRTESFELVEAADPALVYLIFTWIRHRYGSSDPASDAVLGRLLEVSNLGPVAAKMKAGHLDPVVQWFEGEYEYRSFGAAEFVTLVIEKLEG